MIWGKMFEPLHCLNLSIGGDQTQHVLWRVLNGELENIQPKVIVLQVGTNNYEHSAEQISMAIKKIADVIIEKQPQTQLIVMGIPPRGQNPNKLREKIKETNNRLRELFTDLPNVTYVHVDPAIFISAKDETISVRDMYDFLHFTDHGYEKLCEPLLDEIQNLFLSFVKVE
ncbi:platelet-activating factor acetylhydrolase IB subunit alpha2-like isoform X2 [Gigantopelta aegis]|nr:platelet-activating factor acetylhydrolase IB subunit alpha2-like isoform X2 [Gigantopelta aegis]